MLNLIWGEKAHNSDLEEHLYLSCLLVLIISIGTFNVLVFGGGSERKVGFWEIISRETTSSVLFYDFAIA